MRKPPLYILLLLIITSSCSDRELGDGYYYLPKYEAVDVGYPEAIVYKSSQENVFSDVRIRGDVEEIKANSKFIIAKRDPIISRERNTGVLEYYIILKTNDSLIGPLTSEKFKQTTQNLGINLEFD